MSLIRQKKEQKRTGLIEAAHYLFLERGLSGTSIDAIVERAEVAKGTFYLYFKNKDAVLSEVVYEITRDVLLEGYRQAALHEDADFTEKIILVIDYMVEHFKKNPRELQMIKKDFSWSLIREKVAAASQDAAVSEMLSLWAQNPQMQKYPQEQSMLIFYAIIEMCGSLCYSCIIEKQPTDIDSMKPTLYLMVRKMLS